jgi:putative effector of murein hydrolase LrgA (UPF0299 family)
MAILRSFLVLLLFQLAGTVMQTTTRIAVPGPVLGMALLAAWLMFRGNQSEHPLHATATGLLGWLGLFFVPAGVGIIANFALLRSAWLPLAVALVGSTLLTLLVTAGTMHLLQRRMKDHAA